MSEEFKDRIISELPWPGGWTAEVNSPHFQQGFLLWALILTEIKRSMKRSSFVSLGLAFALASCTPKSESTPVGVSPADSIANSANTQAVASSHSKSKAQDTNTVAAETPTQIADSLKNHLKVVKDSSKVVKRRYESWNDPLSPHYKKK